MDLLKKLIRFLFGKKTVTKRVSAAVTRDWQEIDVLLRTGTPSQLKQALIVADRSVGSALRDLVSGESMGERLINAKHLFHPQTYQKLWEAHKLRNALVHESGFEIQHFILKASVENVRRGLMELGFKL